jgi:hypothetical protein
MGAYPTLVSELRPCLDNREGADFAALSKLYPRAQQCAWSNRDASLPTDATPNYRGGVHTPDWRRWWVHFREDSGKSRVWIVDDDERLGPGSHIAEPGSDQNRTRVAAFKVR